MTGAPEGPLSSAQEAWAGDAPVMAPVTVRARRNMLVVATLAGPRPIHRFWARSGSRVSHVPQSLCVTDPHPMDVWRCRDPFTPGRTDRSRVASGRMS